MVKDCAQIFALKDPLHSLHIDNQVCYDHRVPSEIDNELFVFITFKSKLLSLHYVNLLEIKRVRIWEILQDSVTGVLDQECAGSQYIH